MRLARHLRPGTLFTDLLVQIGKLWGDQNEYLVCTTGHRFPVTDETVGLPICPTCGHDLSIHVPHSEELELRWLVWKGEQQWWPQRYYVLPSGHNPDRAYQAWEWRGREWLKRPVAVEDIFGAMPGAESDPAAESAQEPGPGQGPGTSGTASSER